MRSKFTLRILATSLVLVVALIFTGCVGFGGSQSSQSSKSLKSSKESSNAQKDLSKEIGSIKGGVLRSDDGGQTFVPKVSAESENIASVPVFSIAVNPLDGNIVYVGSDKTGIFVTYDGGEKWEQLNFPPTEVYSIAINPFDTNIVYATARFDKRANIYKSVDAGATWESVYTEPVTVSTILDLEISPRSPDTLFAATSEGNIIRTDDGGITWKQSSVVSGAVTDIEVDPTNNQNVYAVYHDHDLLISRDGGETFETPETIAGTKDIKSDGERIQWEGKVYSLVLDNNKTGSVVVGTDEGLVRVYDYGEYWEPLDVIESSKGIPVYAVAINPSNSREVMYAVGTTLYRSQDNGERWSVEVLRVGASVNKIEYGSGTSQKPQKIYVGLRNR